MRKSKFDIDFKTPPIQNFVEFRHPVNTVQVETLDDEISSYTLFKLMQPPIDITKYIVTFESIGGIDPQSASESMNFDITKNQLLSLLHSQSSNVKLIDEFIEEPVLQLVKSVTITDISDFQVDSNFLDFKKVARQSKSVVKKRSK